MTTTVQKSEPRDSSLVLLYDPKDLSEVHLDRVLSESPFETLISAKTLHTILLSSEQHETKVSIQPTRLEFTQELRTPFEERSLDHLKGLLGVLPELSVKAFGLNYMMSLVIQGYKNAGEYVRDKFLKEGISFTSVFGSKPFASATRILFGEPGEYRDVRLTPTDLNTETLALQYHYHKEEAIRDRDRIYRVLSDQHPIELGTLGKLVSQLDA